MAIELYITSNANNMCWYCNYMNHNNYGPAIIWLDGYKEWWVNNEVHRLNGPAIEYSNGHKEWYINSVKYTYLEYIVAIEQLNTNKETYGN